MSLSLPARNLIEKRSNLNYSIDSIFIAPNSVFSNGILYDVNGRYLESIEGKVVAVDHGEVTTLLNNQLNIVSLKGQRDQVEVWPVENNRVFKFWVARKGQRTMVSYDETVITLTSRDHS